jgi:hypothetical protein
MNEDTARPKSDNGASNGILFPFNAFDLSADELPKLPEALAGLTKVAMPAPLKAAAEKTAAQIQEGYSQLATATAQSTDLIRETYEQTADQMKVANQKAFDMARANMTACFDHVRALAEAKSLAEVISMQSAFVRESEPTRVCRRLQLLSRMEP